MRVDRAASAGCASVGPSVTSRPPALLELIELAWRNNAAARLTTAYDAPAARRPDLGSTSSSPMRPCRDRLPENDLQLGRVGLARVV
jgi:hypothetical protein